MTSRLASVTFKMASKVFIEETDKIYDFITEILFGFLGFGDLKVSIFIENLELSTFLRWNVQCGKGSFLSRANFMGNHTDRSHFCGPVHSKIEECGHSNRRFMKGYIILYIVRIFSSSELVEPHIIPLKGRLAVPWKRKLKDRYLSETVSIESCCFTAF